MVMFCRQQPKWDQNPWFVPEMTSILSSFAYRRSSPGLEHLPFKAVSRWVWISAASSFRQVSGERSLKALGDNAVWWRHESNVVIYEISHATFSVKTSLNKTVKFWWTSIISASLSTVYKIGHFTVVCLVTWPWMQTRLEVTLLDTDLSAFLT